MKDTKENRKFINDYFMKSEFTPSGAGSSEYPFMLFGKGWGQFILLCINIQFDSERIKPHICIEYSPCVRSSSFYYMELTQENILKLPKTEKEYYEKYHPLVKNERNDYFKKETK